MNEFRLNYLRFLTGGALPDSVLRTIKDVKATGDKQISFECRIPLANNSFKVWTRGSGSI